MNKYPINSKVIINSIFPPTQEPFCAGMMKYIGKEATVVEYTYLASEGFGYYTLDVDGGKYYWTEEMLDVSVGILLEEFNNSLEMPENIYNLTIDDVKGLIGTYRDFIRSDK